MGKALFGLMTAILATVLAARAAYYGSTLPDHSPADQPWSGDHMQFIAWNGQRWTAWVRDESFELAPANTRRWSRHANTSIAYVDWDGEVWQAKIDGDGFLLARRGDWHGPTEKSNAIRYRDWTGKNQLRSLAQLRR